MPQFSQKSLQQLQTCDARLQNLFMEVVKTYDCIVLEGRRSVEQQTKNVAKGVSKTMDSKHLLKPGQLLVMAADVVPAPLSWPNPPKKDATGNIPPAELTRWMKEYALFYYFGGYVLNEAKNMGYKVRWLGDQDGDRNIKEQSWDDLAHFEISEEV